MARCPIIPNRVITITQMGQVCLLSASVGFITALDVFQSGGTDGLKELKYHEVTMGLP